MPPPLMIPPEFAHNPSRFKAAPSRRCAWRRARLDGLPYPAVDGAGLLPRERPRREGDAALPALQRLLYDIMVDLTIQKIAGLKMTGESIEGPHRVSCGGGRMFSHAQFFAGEIRILITDVIFSDPNYEPDGLETALRILREDKVFILSGCVRIEGDQWTFEQLEGDPLFPDDFMRLLAEYDLVELANNFMNRPKAGAIPVFHSLWEQQPNPCSSGAKVVYSSKQFTPSIFRHKDITLRYCGETRLFASFPLLVKIRNYWPAPCTQRSSISRAP